MIKFIVNFFKKAKDTHNKLIEENKGYIISYSEEKGESKSKFFMDKGELLEKEIFNFLKSIPGLEFRKILVDLQIPTPEGNTTQVDLIFLHKTGIYVIESKILNCCTVHGNNTDDYWLKEYSNGDSYTFHNPLYQNYAHLRSLNSLLSKYKSRCFLSFIVFGYNCSIEYHDQLSSLNYKTSILNSSNFKKEIKKTVDSRLPIISDDDLISIYKNLDQYSKVSQSSKKAHVEYVKSSI